FEPVAAATGATVDELKLVFSFLLSYPFAGVLKRIPDRAPWAKNAFIIATSLLYLVGLFDLWGGLRTLFVAAAGTYGIAACVRAPWMPWLGFAFVMAHMAWNHAVRQAVDDPGAVDITGAQMVLVMKLSAFCWNVHDGRTNAAHLTPRQRYAALPALPPLLDYAAWVLFFPSLFAGPAFDFVDYRRWLETSLFDHPPGTDTRKAPRVRGARRIPRSGTPAAAKAAQGLAWIAAFLACSARFPADLPLQPGFLARGPLARVALMHLVGLTARLKYYGVWKLTEGACILSGMGYNGFDPLSGAVHWDALENVDPLALETAQNAHAYLAAWNKNTNHWLRNCVYLRVTPAGRKPGFRATLATFSTSAFWHGFYPGYYLTFVLGSLIQTSAKMFRRHVRPFFFVAAGQGSTVDANATPTAWKPAYDAASWLATQLVMSFAVAPFITLRFGPSVEIWARLYYYGIVGVGGSMLFFACGGKEMLDARLRARRGSKEDDGKHDGQNKEAGEEIAETDKEKVEPVLGLPADVEREVGDAVRGLGDGLAAVRRRPQAESESKSESTSESKSEL
ncbi:lysophospholipid acyltransferase, partial [Ascosphaera acerosa]